MRFISSLAAVQGYCSILESSGQEDVKREKAVWTELIRFHWAKFLGGVGSFKFLFY